MNASKEDLVASQDELRQMTPAPMNSMLEKQPREEAIEKHLHRKSIVVEEVPPTCAGTFYMSSYTIIHFF